jgi:hypothetical protein
MKDGIGRAHYTPNVNEKCIQTLIRKIEVHATVVEEGDIYTKFWSENHTEIDYLKLMHTDGRTLLKSM